MEKLFDLSAEYDEMLNKGIKLSGENKQFFIKGRIVVLMKRLPQKFVPKTILDFGCGTGETSLFLSSFFPGAEVVGVDLAARAVDYANAQNTNERVKYYLLDCLPDHLKFDLCYCNGVFHHINIPDRLVVLSMIESKINKNGFFTFFENNPWNVGARMIMKRIAFDRDAIMISPKEGQRLLKHTGFRINKIFFVFFFPNKLKIFRPIEPLLFYFFPVGAQYCVLAGKSD